MTDAPTIERDIAEDIGVEAAGIDLPPAAQLPAVIDPAARFLPVPLEMIERVADYLHGMAGIPAFISESLPTCRAVAYRAARWNVDPVFVAEQAYQAKAGGPLGYQAQLVNAIILANAPFDRRPRLVYGYGGDGRALAMNRFVKVFFFMCGEAEPLVLTTPTVAQIRIRNSPLWASDPDQQLSYYAIRAAARRYCPDVLAGVYTTDEVQVMAVVDHGPKRSRALFEEDEPPAAPIDAEFEGVPPTEADAANFKRWEAKQEGGDSRDPRDDPRNGSGKAQDGLSASDGASGHPERQRPSAATEPPPAGNLEPDDLPELRAWAATEQAAIMAMDDHVAATDAWGKLIREPKWKRFKAFDQASANVIKTAVFAHIEARRNA